MSKEERRHGFVRPQAASAKPTATTTRWAEAIAIYRAQRQTHHDASTARMQSQRPGEPRSAPPELVETENAAQLVYFEARDALIGTPAPHMAAFLEKLDLICEYANDVLRPSKPDNVRAIEADPSEWPAGVAALSVYRYGTAVREAKYDAPSLAPMVRDLAALIVETPEGFGPFDVLDAAHVEWAKTQNPVFNGFVALGCVALYFDAVSLSGHKPPAGPTTPNPDRWAAVTFSDRASAPDPKDEAGDDAPTGRAEWDAAAAAVIAEYEREDEQFDSDALAAAVDRLLTLMPPDLDAFRLLFEVIMTETQALGTRAAADYDAGPEPLTDARLMDSVSWPERDGPWARVTLVGGQGLRAGLVHLRRALDHLSGHTTSPFNGGTEA